ncbi:Ankyrin-2 [Lambiella insularis]|nr:Ankyrin-2 [Lambiella insularis]
MTRSLPISTIDDLLYLARTNDLSSLRALLSTTATAHNLSLPTILSRTLDPDTHNTPLHMAAANGHTETIQFLLSLLPPPALVNAQNLAGNTPLHYACLNGHVKVAKILLAAGADRGVVNQAGYSAVDEAERSGMEVLGEGTEGGENEARAKAKGGEEGEGNGETGTGKKGSYEAEGIEGEIQKLEIGELL